MQAILKSEYQKLCDLIQNAKSKQLSQDSVLVKLEDELNEKYKKYQQKMEELRQIVSQYEEKKKKIRNRIKLNLKYRYDLVHKKQ